MNNENSKTFLLVLLGLLTAFGPFVTDMYLPTLPSMTGYFGTTSSMVQLGLTSSMIGLALGQLFFGPLSDRYGRRPPLIAAMALFIVSTILCIFASDIRQFILLRLLQGIAGAGGIVISRSVAADRFTGAELARMLAVIGAINGVTPVTAPIVGGALTDVIGWRGIFCILLALGCVLLISCLRFRESLPATRRSSAGWGQLLHGFGAVLHNRPFVGYILQLGFAQGILFGNIASSPFIVQEHYGFSAFGFSLCFAANSLAIMSAAALAVRFRRQERATLLGCRGMLLFSLATAAALACHCGFWLYEMLVFALLFSMGITFPATTTLAMDCRASTPARPRRCWAPSASPSAASYRRSSAWATRCSRPARSSSSAPSDRGLRSAAPCTTATGSPSPEKGPSGLPRNPAMSGSDLQAPRRAPRQCSSGSVPVPTPQDKKSPEPSRFGIFSCTAGPPHTRHPCRRTTECQMRTLTMILRTVPSPTIGAWPSSGKRIVN